MAEETTDTSTVKNVSDGMVKLTLEVYNDLVERSRQKAPVNHVENVIERTVVTKTDEQQASDNQAWGLFWIGGGLALTGLGAAMAWTGRRQAKRLEVSKRDAAL